MLCLDLQGPVQVMLVPEEHAQGLLRVVAVLLLGHLQSEHCRKNADNTWTLPLVPEGTCNYLEVLESTR